MSVAAEDPAEAAIQAAIDQLEQSADKANDPLAKAKIHKAIRELEIILNVGNDNSSDHSGRVSKRPS